MSRNNPTADNYLQNKNKNLVGMSNIISRSDEKAHDDNKYRNDIITTEPDAENVPYQPYEFDVAGGLLRCHFDIYCHHVPYHDSYSLYWTYPPGSYSYFEDSYQQ